MAKIQQNLPNTRLASSGQGPDRLALGADLHQAIIRRDHAQVRALIKAGADETLTTKNGRTALELAIFVENLPAMVQLAGRQQLTLASDDVWVAALSRGEYRIRDLPRARRSEALCNAAFKGGCAYKELPRAMRKPALMARWVKDNKNLLGKVPRRMRFHRDFYLPLLPHIGDHYRACLAHWPNRFIHDVIISGVDCLSIIPEERRTAFRCNLAIDHSGDNLRAVPAKYRSYELCQKAMQSGCDLHEVPEPMRDEAMIATLLRSIRQAPHTKRYALALPREALACIPESLRAYDICLDTVRINFHALDLVPMAMRDVAMGVAAFPTEYSFAEEREWFYSLIPECFHEEITRLGTEAWRT